VQVAAMTSDLGDLPELDIEGVVHDLAIDAAGVGIFDWNLVTGELRWDDRLLEIFDTDRESFGGTIEAFNAFVHPEDLPRTTHELDRALADCDEFLLEYRVPLRDGTVRWVAARGRVLCGEGGTAVRLIGAAFDNTATVDSEARVSRVLEAMPSAFFHLDPQWRFGYVNAEAERLLGRPRDQLVGGTIWELFPAAVGSDFETFYRGAMESGQPVTFEAYYPEPLDAWYEIRSWPSPDGLSVYFLDITERRRSTEAAEAAARRTTLLAQVSEQLAGTLETEEGVGRLASLIVPTFADWCVVTLVRDAGSEVEDWRRNLQDVGWWHASGELLPAVEEYSRHRLAALTDESFIAQSLRTGRPVVIPGNARQAVLGVMRHGTAQEQLDLLDPLHGVVVPLKARGRIVGLVTLFRGSDGRAYDSDDLETLQEVATRAGLALDNARLFAQQRDLAEGLQRSLLTAPPETDDLQVVVRYEPAGAAAQVGGDWYDAFLQRDRATILVVGDVVGHDVEAAAAMGQVRSLLRGIAVHSGEGPAAVLSGLDLAMQTLQTATTATAVVVRIEQDDEAHDSGTTNLRWSNAGHPPPLVINPDRSVTELANDGADLLLGLDPDTDRAESVTTVQRGATVFLYTDGLVERRGQPIDAGIALLRSVLEELAPRDLDVGSLCDEVLHRLVPDRAEDDVALVAVRLHPQG
jgi:PAS domain S-box-containing protein